MVVDAVYAGIVVNLTRLAGTTSDEFDLMLVEVGDGEGMDWLVGGASGVESSVDCAEEEMGN